MDIALLRRPIEQRLTAATGLHATLGKIDVSVFGASLEITGLTLTAPDAPGPSPERPPVVSIESVRVELSIRKAFQGEIRIREIAIDRPVVYLRRDAAGRWTVPRKPPRGAAPRAAPSPASSSESPGSSNRRPLLIVVDRATLTRGEIDVIQEGGVEAPDYRVAATGITADVRRDADRYAITLRGDHVARTDARMAEIASLGGWHISAELGAADNLARLDGASLRADATVGDATSPLLRAEATIERLIERVARFSLDVATDAATMRAWAPRPLPAPIASARGTITLRARGSADLGGPALELEEFALAAALLTFGK